MSSVKSAPSERLRSRVIQVLGTCVGAQHTKDIYAAVAAYEPSAWYEDVLTVLKALMADGLVAMSPPTGKGPRRWRLVSHADRYEMLMERIRRLEYEMAAIRVELARFQ